MVLNMRGGGEGEGDIPPDIVGGVHPLVIWFLIPRGRREYYSSPYGKGCSRPCDMDGNIWRKKRVILLSQFWGVFTPRLNMIRNIQGCEMVILLPILRGCSPPYDIVRNMRGRVTLFPMSQGVCTARDMVCNIRVREGVILIPIWRELFTQAQ